MHKYGDKFTASSRDKANNDMNWPQDLLGATVSGPTSKHIMSKDVDSQGGAGVRDSANVASLIVNAQSYPIASRDPSEKVNEDSNLPSKTIVSGVQSMPPASGRAN